MGKIGIIIQREYLSRVKKRSFILTTLGLPILMLAFSVLMGFVMAKSASKIQIAVIDESGVFEHKIWDSSKNKTIAYFDKGQLENLKTSYADKNYDMLLHIAPFTIKPDSSTIKVYTEGSLGLESGEYLNNRLNTIFQEKAMLDAGFNRQEIDSLSNIDLKINTISKDKNSTSSAIASGIGFVSGFLLYLLMIVYGMMVMRGVSEEKTNRIAEVIISSVKPFELMMGKVIGIALVGLTQFFLWVVFMGILSTVLASLIPGFSDMLANSNGSTAMMQEAMKDPKINRKAMEAFVLFKDVPWLKIVFCFMLYFTGGYFLYASLFAAVGSMANEDIQESQALTFPITMPIVIAFIIAMQAMKDPHSNMAVFGSIFPLTSPIVMMARIGYNPPIWQIALSLALLFATFMGTIWVAGKIYRTGILMYGKKSSWKDAWKWLRQ
jgi:ABC-2 type transport system permease protein